MRLEFCPDDTQRILSLSIYKSGETDRFKLLHFIQTSTEDQNISSPVTQAEA